VDWQLLQGLRRSGFLQIHFVRYFHRWIASAGADTSRFLAHAAGPRLEVPGRFASCF